MYSHVLSFIVSDIVLAVIVMIASTLLFPVAAVLYFVIKKKKQEESARPCMCVSAITARSSGLVLLCIHIHDCASIYSVHDCVYVCMNHE